MAFLQGLHGTVAAVLICILLFVDEAGLPLPIAPNELLLVLTGMLVASGAFPLWVIGPAVLLAMTAGMVSGYAWARAAGQPALQKLAEAVNASDVYERARRRLRSASAWGIALARLLPGLRPYATLVSGAAEVYLGTFLLGAVPVLVIWGAVWIAVGMLVGLPLVHVLGRFERLALRGVVLLALGIVALLAIRDAAAERQGGVARLAPRLRASLALAADAAIVASMVGGVFALGRRLLQVSANGWVELVAAALVLLALLVIGRGVQTPGESLFNTHYWHPSTVRSRS